MLAAVDQMGRRQWQADARPTAVAVGPGGWKGASAGIAHARAAGQGPCVQGLSVRGAGEG